MDKKRKQDKMIEETIGNAVIDIVLALSQVIKYSFLGIADVIKSRSLVKLTVLITSSALTIISIDILPLYGIHKAFSLIIPLICIATIGYFAKTKKAKTDEQQEKYLDKLRNIFGAKAEISLVDHREENGNFVEIFKTNIPINTWRSKEEQIRHFYKVDYIDISYTPNTKCIKVTSFMEEPKDNRFKLEVLFHSTIQLIQKDEDEIKTVEIFKTDVHLDSWETKLPQIKHIYKATYVEVSYANDSDIKLISYKVDVPNFIEWKEDYIDKDENIVIGNSLTKGNFKIDFNETPHLITAGETGSGKSVLISCIIIQLLHMVNKTSSKIDIIVSDFKGGIDYIHFSPKIKIITDLKEFEKLLRKLKIENERRLNLLLENKCKNIKEFNRKFNEKLDRKIIIVDEIAVVTDKMGALKDDKEIMEQIEGLLSDLARRSRATGINLIIGVQIPNFKILPGQIKNNCPGRICGRFADSTASNIVLGSNAAANLPAIKGRMIYKSGLDIIEFQGFFVNVEKEMEKIFQDDDNKSKGIIEPTIPDPVKVNLKKTNSHIDEWKTKENTFDNRPNESDELVFNRNDMEP